MTQYVIFSVDDHENPFRMNQIAAWFAHLTVSKTIKSNVTSCVGVWRGKTERSFICRADDFPTIRNSGICDEQEAFLYVAGGNKMECYLEYADGRRERMGCMHQVSREEALASEGYTYRPDLDIYWVAKEGNPDRVRDDMLDVARFTFHSTRTGRLPVAHAAE